MIPAALAYAFTAAAHSLEISEPCSVSEALKEAQSLEWKDAIEKELNFLWNMGTFTIVDALPPERKAIESHLVFKIKRLGDGSIECYKARLVAQEFSQIPGLDFDETYAPVVKLTSIRILCALAVRLKLHFHHLDVDTAFFNGELDEELYMHLPQGIGEHAGKIVCLLKSIYGLKQAGRIWNQFLDAKIKKMGFKRIHADFCIYILKKDGYICIIAVYIDDIGVLCNDLVFIACVKKWISRHFKIKDLGPMKLLLGIYIC
jgi:hypothetical protein